MRDWLTAFRPASFRGTSFFVEVEEAEGGRRLAISPIAYSNDHITEDMGKQHAIFTVTAYVVGDAADAAAVGFVAALEASGAATLMLPMLGSKRVRVSHWRLARDKRRAGYVAFDVEFTAAGRSSPLFATVPGSLRISELFAIGASILGSALSMRMKSQTPGQANRSSLSTVAGASTIEAVGRSANLAADDATELSDKLSIITKLANDPIANAATIAEGMVGCVDLILAKGDPYSIVLAVRKVTFLAADPFDVALSSTLAAAYCQAIVSVEYDARQDARAARDTLSPIVDPVLVDAATLDVSVNEWLSGIVSIAASDLSDDAANRSPLVRVQTSASLSASALAYALYGSVDRAGELARRNAVATPALMPTEFEAVAP